MGMHATRGGRRAGKLGGQAGQCGHLARSARQLNQLKILLNGSEIDFLVLEDENLPRTWQAAEEGNGMVTGSHAAMCRQADVWGGGQACHMSIRHVGGRARARSGGQRVWTGRQAGRQTGKQV
jgi:hypothetical protein